MMKGNVGIHLFITRIFIVIVTKLNIMKNT